MDGDEIGLKDAYAAVLLRMPSDPFKAACQIFGVDTARALRVARDWVNDPYVLARQSELLEQFGEDLFLPSRLTTARAVYELAIAPKTDKKDSIAAFRLYAEMMRYVDKGSQVNVLNNRTTTITQNRVLVLKDHGTDDEWENKAIEHQAKLVADART